MLSVAIRIVLYTDCALYWLCFILIVLYTEGALYWVCFMLSVVYAECCLCRVLFALSVVILSVLYGECCYTECPLRWVSFTVNVAILRNVQVSVVYAVCCSGEWWGSLIHSVVFFVVVLLKLYMQSIPFQQGGGMNSHYHGILKGEVSLYRWSPVWLFWISLFCK
jgi:hypothetical protein